MRFAYADPPYPRLARKWYRDHPDYAGEVDHAELIGRLCREYPDGWALSTNAISLRHVLVLCPEDVRTAVWHKTNEAPPGARPDWWWNWEPVIVRGGRLRPVRTVFSSGQNGNDTRFPGSKPPGFTRWMIRLLGADVEDTIDDLFPGSGIVGREIEAWRSQPELAVPEGQSAVVVARKTPGRAARDLRRAKVPGLLDLLHGMTKDDTDG